MKKYTLKYLRALLPKYRVRKKGLMYQMQTDYGFNLCVDKINDVFEKLERRNKQGEK